MISLYIDFHHKLDVYWNLQTDSSFGRSEVNCGFFEKLQALLEIFWWNSPTIEIWLESQRFAERTHLQFVDTFPKLVSDLTSFLWAFKDGGERGWGKGDGKYHQLPDLKSTRVQKVRCRYVLSDYNLLKWVQAAREWCLVVCIVNFGRLFSTVQPLSTWPALQSLQSQRWHTDATHAGMQEQGHSVQLLLAKRRIARITCQQAAACPTYAAPWKTFQLNCLHCRLVFT